MSLHFGLQADCLLGVSQLASKISLVKPEMAVFDLFFLKKKGKGRFTSSPVKNGKRNIFESSTCKMNLFPILRRFFFVFCGYMIFILSFLLSPPSCSPSPVLFSSLLFFSLPLLSSSLPFSPWSSVVSLLCAVVVIFLCFCVVAASSAALLSLLLPSLLVLLLAAAVAVAVFLSGWSIFTVTQAIAELLLGALCASRARELVIMMMDANDSSNSFFISSFDHSLRELTEDLQW